MPPTEENLEALFTLESQRTGIVEEPPFKILVLGDLAGDAERWPVSDRRLIEIDRDNFDGTIEKLGVRLELEYGDSVLGLEFRSLDDMHPDQIFARVPIFLELRELRKRLKSEETFYSAATEVRERFDVTAAEEKAPTASSEETTPEAPLPDNLLDAILTTPTGGGAAPKPELSRDIADLVNEIVRPHLVSVDDDEQTRMIAAVDAATSGLMRGILHDRRFKELEATWRGLFSMVRRIETSTDLKIYLLDISKDELADNLKGANSLSETTLFRHLINDTIETPGGEPFAVVLGNYTFDANVDDIATLMRVGKLASAANAPFISYMLPEVFGVRSLAESHDPASWKIPEDSEAGRLWKVLCSKPEAEYLGMVMPRLLSRLPYGADTDPLENFSFEEFVDQPFHELYAWANPCFAMGLLLAESYSAYGWEMGRALKQDIDGLPVHVYKEGTETVYKPCAEVLLTDLAFQKLMEFGFMAFVTFKNSDRVKLTRYQSIADTALKALWA
ncbi:MAG TPA: type VI secretion system contractile sheath large subunit [Pyrinomonadaceae bacterium]|nr:type VI secretion system contractile sheath large subunit [Pyrinomonadaceae bacterium]HMP64663.1 type VI secretion system contractile sheath large subunit [Pyrinomonadaceae bacterium]